MKRTMNTTNTTNAPEEHDEVLKRMRPYLRVHLHEMYVRAAANGHTEYMHAAMLLDNVVLDDFRIQYAKTLNQQAPTPYKPKSHRGRHRKKLSAAERAAIREQVIKGKALARDPAVIVAVMEEQES
jgi:hypothetical protein